MTTLDSLPTEVVNLVASAICRDRSTAHCLAKCQHDEFPVPNFPSSNETPTRSHAERFRALNALCLTSRRLHAVALLHLYHHVETPFRWWHLGNTLVARPDLAAHVRSFYYTYLDDLKYDYHDCGNEATRDRRLHAAFLRRRRAYLDTLPYSPRPWTLVSSQTLRDGTLHMPMDLLISLLPNLEVVSIHMTWGPAFRFCLPDSLPRLRHVDVSFREPDYDPSNLGMAHTAPLFRAARTSLKSVVLRRCAYYPPLRTRDRVSEQQKRRLEELERDGVFDDVDEDYRSLEDDWYLYGVKRPPSHTPGALEDGDRGEDRDEESDAYVPYDYSNVGHREEDSELDGQPTLPNATHLALCSSFPRDGQLRNLLMAFPNLAHLCILSEEIRNKGEIEAMDPLLRELTPRLESFVLYRPESEKNNEAAKRLLQGLEARGVQCTVKPAHGSHLERIEAEDENKVVASWVLSIP
ncbi:hypothetical protein VTJ83DRAFT_2921 [Remersonia thermophila]|uniref:F-box domain-containing protein n=1 Tax=Remersonia thermophila TaxID=72144 RepID=A0ABR4DCN8_9PEZI